MNIANWLTMLRILLAFICIGFILRDTFASLLIAFSVFVVASITDFLDGFIARKKNLISDLGKILDPIADKILIIGVFIAFLQLGIINAWMVSVIILREYIITHVRLYNFNKGVVLEAKALGKHKTFSQVLGILFIFITLLLYKQMPESRVVGFLYNNLISWVMWYVMGITLVSGVHYFWINRRSIKTF